MDMIAQVNIGNLINSLKVPSSNENILGNTSQTSGITTNSEDKTKKGGI